MSDTAAVDEGSGGASAALVAFMRYFERWQQTLDFRQPGNALADLRAAHDALLASGVPAHAGLAAVLEIFSGAVARLAAARGADFALAFIDSRRRWCEGLARAYGLRDECAPLKAYWTMEDTPQDATARGGRVTHHAASEAHAGYALYEPDDDSRAAARPLIVCLHGAYGHGHEYLWTWMRVAHSHGCLVLAPKSRGPTWSLLDPEVDISSVRAMLAAVAERHGFDATRVYLSGLSDGGSFAYCLGLSCPSVFAGVAPIAGVLHPVMDRLLRARHGQSLPLFVVHGARDFIFDVRSVRSQCQLLDKLGYRITYTELPEWGHAYTDDIHERLVWPWFAALPSGR